jgi:hypothetical protein
MYNRGMQYVIRLCAVRCLLLLEVLALPTQNTPSKLTRTLLWHVEQIAVGIAVGRVIGITLCKRAGCRVRHARIGGSWASQPWPPAGNRFMGTVAASTWIVDLIFFTLPLLYYCGGPLANRQNTERKVRYADVAWCNPH